MPTAAKLVGAICLAVLGWFVADLIKPHLPEGTQVGLFSPISAAWGFVVGWGFTGKRLGDGTGTAVGIGMGSIFLLGFWVLLSFAGYEMIRLSTRLRYDGPVEALQDMFQIGVDYLWVAATPEVIGTLLAGGLVTGVITAFVAKRWQ